MPSVKQVLGAVVFGFAAVGSALPAVPKFSQQLSKFMTRQNPATGLPDGLTDVDVLELYVAFTLGFTNNY